MAQTLAIHPEHPQARLLKKACDIISANGVIVYPTDTAYALGCRLGAKAPLARIQRIRQVSENHYFSMICQDLSQIGLYAKVDNAGYRLLKAYSPGPYTFILNATKEVPRKLLHPKRKTIGIRVPDHKIISSLLAYYAAPLLTTTLMLPKETLPLSDPEEIKDRLGKQVDLIIDGGPGTFDETTVIDLTDATPTLVRQGVGVVDF